MEEERGKLVSIVAVNLRMEQAIDSSISQLVEKSNGIQIVENEIQACRLELDTLKDETVRQDARLVRQLTVDR